LSIVNYQLSIDSKHCIGIDLGGTFIKFGLLSDKREASETFQLPTPSTTEELVARMVEGARELMARHALETKDVVGVGIGAPGPADLANGVIIVTPNIPALRNLPIRDLISKALGLPAILENDANAAGYGEFLCGAAKGTRNMVLLTLGTGIGSGIVVDGKVLHGSHGLGAELGHMIVQPGDEMCGCGQRGCLERYSSAHYLARYAARLVKDGRPSSLAAILSRGEIINSRDINEARKAGDHLAAEVWDRGAYYLGIACVSICRIFDPEMIVFGGGMAAAGEDLLEPVRRHFSKQDWKLTANSAQIGIATLENEAGCIGAAGVAWDMFGK
jgi:glucokinase